MNKLEEARTIINQIDEEMIKLFIRRMQASKIVAEYKKQNQLPITDSRREQEIISNNLKKLNQKDLESYYLTFFESILKVSKSYQEDLLK